MAIRLTTRNFREAVGAALDDAFNPDWAVYYDYDQSDMTHKIAKVEPWDYWRHSMDGPGARRHFRPGIIRIREARDEIDAYMQAKKQLEQAE